MLNALREKAISLNSRHAVRLRNESFDSREATNDT
jgi:hypothetical protein